MKGISHDRNNGKDMERELKKPRPLHICNIIQKHVISSGSINEQKYKS